jgi:predicted lipoprotein with Yx(FWY)xxD motif
MTAGPAGQGRRALARRLAMVTVVVVAAACAGCSGSGVAVTSPFSTAPPVLQHGPVYQVKVRNVAGLGPVLVDGQGITLYLFTTDQRGQPSRCYQICAVQWPPLTLPHGVLAPIAGVGIQSRLLGSSPRTDGTTQVTYNGWPLYLWPPDRAPGQANGQALTNAGGQWYAVDPSGNAVKTSGSA